MLICLLGAIAFARLDPGPHIVGYRAYFLFDKARRYGPGKAPRPILVAMWYPAMAATGEPLRYREYLALPPLEGYGDFAARLQKFLLNTVSDDIFGEKRADLGAEEQAFLDALLARATHAYRDAPPAEGRFPVLLYHSGAAGSYEDNSALCEYLASHGYILMTSAFQSPDGKHVSNNYGGPETSWDDMAFLLAHAKTLGFAEPLAIGAFGHSMGAQYVLEWLGQKHTRVGAAVSLDTTLEYTPEDLPGHLGLRKRIGRLAPAKIPVLVVASADRHPRFATWDRYLPCRAEAAVPYFEHNDYLLHGVLAHAFTGKNAEEVRSNSEQLARTVRAFFDAKLRKEPAGWERLLTESGGDFRVSQRACDAPNLNR